MSALRPTVIQLRPLRPPPDGEPRREDRRPPRPPRRAPR
jgi:hypothetical protein